MNDHDERSKQASPNVTPAPVTTDATMHHAGKVVAPNAKIAAGLAGVGPMKCDHCGTAMEYLELVHTYRCGKCGNTHVQSGPEFRSA